MILPVSAAIFIKVYARFKALQWKWWLEGVRIGDVRATSTLGAHALTGNYWTFVGVLFASIVGAVTVALAIGLMPKIPGIIFGRIPIYLALIGAVFDFLPANRLRPAGVADRRQFAHNS